MAAKKKEQKQDKTTEKVHPEAQDAEDVVGGEAGEDPEWKEDGHPWIGQKVLRGGLGRGTAPMLATCVKWAPAGKEADEPAL